MSSPRQCHLSRLVGAQLWHRRHSLHWSLEEVARRSGLSVCRIMQTELCADSGPELNMLCLVLGLDQGELLARCNGHIVRDFLSGYDLVVDPPEDNEGHPF